MLNEKLNNNPQWNLTALVFAYIWCLGLNKDYSAYVKAKIKNDLEAQRKILTQYPHIDDVYQDFADVSSFRKLKTKKRLKLIQEVAGLFSTMAIRPPAVRASCHLANKAIYSNSIRPLDPHTLYMHLQVPVSGSKTKLIKDITSLINSVYDDQRFIDSKDSVRPKYELRCKINQHSVRRVWRSLHIRELFESVKRSPSPTKTKLVAESLINPKRSNVVRDILKHPYSEINLLNFDAYNESMRTQLNRFKRDGEEIIKSTITNQFPNYK